jgi:hypothetical protein
MVPDTCRHDDAEYERDKHPKDGRPEIAGVGFAEELSRLNGLHTEQYATACAAVSVSPMRLDRKAEVLE